MKPTWRRAAALASILAVTSARGRGHGRRDVSNGGAKGARRRTMPRSSMP